ncbi:DUF6333 family protein [Streptomyces palmae]|uniref:Uncharacterized protein n=1 Tax=Streptomyces palmae TaxID=1701085 RepID=A0A4Z0H7N2_9ACTN|nr:DUF6333 family protein [Streptomyces palmae]TGB08088.1 hypothetical protein E4099_16105 [Streptomyces palmae]
MTGTSYWTCPPETDVRRTYFGEYAITLLDPSLTGGTITSAPHDPARAREFVEGFPTVEAVVEELPPLPPSELLATECRSDLDLVTVGCWGSAICVSDPALTAYDAGMTPVLDVATSLRERYPRALIVGSAHADFGESHTEDVIWLPDGPRLFASGFPCYEDPWDIEGDPRAVLDALGVDPDGLEGDYREFLHLDEAPHLTNWGMLGALVLERAGHRPGADLEMSVFRVRHTEEYTAVMEEMWLPGL